MFRTQLPVEQMLIADLKGLLGRISNPFTLSGERVEKTIGEQQASMALFSFKHGHKGTHNGLGAETKSAIPVEKSGSGIWSSDLSAQQIMMALASFVDAMA